MPTLYLVDGHAQFFRAYHAIRPGMKSPVTDEPTNMTFGFVGMILKVLRQDRPDYLFILPWNLKDEIIRQMSFIKEWDGKFIVPIPEAEIVSYF